MKTIHFRDLRHQWRIYALLIPAVLLVATFSYYPAASAMYHAFYDWNGDDVAQYTGLTNFRRAIEDPTLGKAFGIVMIFVLSNFFKMIPSIVTAVVIHRMISGKSRYIYRVLFVIPMIIPGIVWLLIWKFFYDPNVGVLNKILNATGGMGLLQTLDGAMPHLAEVITPYRTALLDPLFGGTFGFAMAGVLVLSFMAGTAGLRRGWIWYALLLPAAFLLYGGASAFAGDGGRQIEGLARFGLLVFAAIHLGEFLHGHKGYRGDEDLGRVLSYLAALGAALLICGLLFLLGADLWFLGAGLLIAASIALVLGGLKGALDFASRSRLGGAVAALLGIAGLVIAWKWYIPMLSGSAVDPYTIASPIGDPWIMSAGVVLVLVLVALTAWFRGADGTGVIKWTGGMILGAAFVLIVLSLVWTEPTAAFDRSSPAWLGDEDLALPAMIFWGFPWVGVVSVLLYLAGLGNIDESVYEASDIDGCGALRKFTHVEFPLIMTQVRLNLVLMIINTMKGWGLVFIIWGDSGGPGGAVMLPGLYMFRKAFRDLEAGYACAIGLLLFLLIVVLTIINNKYVRVEK